ncbi:MAG: hypothetical protein WAN23_00670 [Candidatus Acidiferrales bacterium]
MSASKKTKTEQVAEIYAALLKFPAFLTIPKTIQGFLLAGLSEKNLLGVLTEAGMEKSVALLVTGGMLKSDAVVQSIVAYALGLIPTDAVPDSGGGKPTEPAAVAAEATPPTNEVLSALTEAAPKLVADKFVEGVLSYAKKHPSSVQMSRWVN